MTRHPKANQGLKGVLAVATPLGGGAKSPIWGRTMLTSKRRLIFKRSFVGHGSRTKYTYADAYNASLVTKVKYPDGDDNNDNVQTAYWLDGRPKTRTDQRGTVITFDYDTALHRPQGQAVTTLGTNVDGAIRGMGATFDALGRTTAITSYGTVTVASGVISYSDARNDVAYTYNTLGMRTDEYEEHGGAKGQNTPDVQYGYDDSNAAGAYTKGMRPASIGYPNGRGVYYLYTDAANQSPNYESSGLGDALSRVTAIAGAAHRGTAATEDNVLAAYAYNGSGRIVEVQHPQVAGGLVLSYRTAAGVYGGWDGFGRVADQKWQTGGGTPTVVDEYGYGYDANSNRLYRKNMITAAAKLSEIYHADGAADASAYDGLDRLKEFRRGTLSTDNRHIASDAGGREVYSLDGLGNWAEFQKSTTDGGTWDLDQTRTHNAVNETTGLSGGSWGVPAYDAAGNMTYGPRPGQESTAAEGELFVYDAWNRVVQVWKDSGGTTPDQTLVTMGDNKDTLLAEYRYDALNRRIVKLIPNATVTTNWDRTDCYYNGAWQCAEERVTLNVTTANRETPATTVKFQYVWDLRYIDAPICRDENKNANGSCTDAATGIQGANTGDEHLYYANDANMNVTALVDAFDGAVVERYTYDPYGKATVRHGVRDSTGAATTEWDPRAANTFGNEILYCGYRFDPETGLYLARHRYYHPTMGRWITRDPAGYGPNLLIYCTGSPEEGRDPLGLFDAKSFISGVAGGVIGAGQAAWDGVKDAAGTIGEWAAATAAIDGMYFGSNRQAPGTQLSWWLYNGVFSSDGEDRFIDSDEFRAWPDHQIHETSLLARNLETLRAELAAAPLDQTVERSWSDVAQNQGGGITPGWPCPGCHDPFVAAYTSYDIHVVYKAIIRKDSLGTGKTCDYSVFLGGSYWIHNRFSFIDPDGTWKSTTGWQGLFSALQAKGGRLGRAFYWNVSWTDSWYVYSPDDDYDKVLALKPHFPSR